MDVGDLSFVVEDMLVTEYVSGIADVYVLDGDGNKRLLVDIEKDQDGDLLLISS